MDPMISDNTIIDPGDTPAIRVGDAAVTVADNVWGDDPNE